MGHAVPNERIVINFPQFTRSLHNRVSDRNVRHTRKICNSRHWWTSTERMQRGLSDPTITLTAISRYSILRALTRQTVQIQE